MWRAPCNPASRRPGLEDGLRPGVLHRGRACRRDVRAKRGVDMVTPAYRRPGLEDGLRPGVLHRGRACRRDVRAKRGVDMVTPGEPGGGPGRLRRSEPAQGGDAAGKSSRALR
ncbi:hypothetical protein MTO96_045410 [Rhipicephalus appendiculatus]